MEEHGEDTLDVLNALNVLKVVKVAIAKCFLSVQRKSAKIMHIFTMDLTRKAIPVLN